MHFDHSHEQTAVLMVEPFDLVHKRPHEQDAAARCFQQIFGVGRVRNVVRVKARTKIADQYLNTVAGVQKRYLNVLIGVKRVTVFDGVGDRFANGQVNGGSNVVTEAVVTNEAFGEHGRFVNRFDRAG